MIVTPRTASYDPTLEPSAAAAHAAAPAALAEAARRDRRIFWGTMLVVTVMFALLQNPYWVPAGDSEVYTSVARSLANGEGYRFNRQPVAMVPPGWPWAMSIVMSITSSFLALKLFTMCCMIGALAFTYRVCRRFVSPGWASFVVLAMASLSHVYQATFWLISEALFCLITSWSLLVAMHIKERATTERGREGWWRIALLCVLCCVAVLVRWAGVLGILPIAAILLHGESAWPRVNRLWGTCVIAGLVTLATFLALRASLAGWETSESAPLTTVAIAESGEAAESGGGGGVVFSDRLVGMQYSIISTSGMGGTTYGGRVIGWGRWFSWLYWQPFRAGMGDPLIDLGAQVLGWIIIGLLVFASGYGAARREWMWLAMLIYTFMLTINWPNVNPRYFVPIFFLLLIAMLRAGDALRSFGPGIWRGTIAVLLWTFLGSMILTNVGLWAIDVKVARSEDFYTQYEAGLNNTIISANRYLTELPDLRDGQVAVTPSYINLGKKRQSHFALRVTTMLTDRATVSIPRKKQFGPSTRLAWWCQHYGIKYYLHQRPISPWRVWHFRVPAAWQERLQGAPVEATEAGWTLYRIIPYVPAIPGVLDEIPPKMVLVETPPSHHWPTRVPGL